MNFNNSTNLIEVEFFIHSIPRSLVRHFEWEVEHKIGIKHPINWQKQPLDQFSLKSEFKSVGELNRVVALISQLSKWGKVRWEIYCSDLNEHKKFRFSITPSLGIYRADINELGETILTESQINSVITRAIHENIDIKDELNFVLGKPWDDELEIFRINFKDQPIKHFKSYGT